MRFNRLAVPVAVVILFAACSDDAEVADTTARDSSTTLEATEASETSAEPATTAAPTSTTLSVADLANAYTEQGPYPVGVTTLQLAKGPLVEVWYPAVDGTTGTETYDVRDFTPPAIQALLTGEAPATYTYAAGRDADLAEGEYPVVLFSHGYTGIRLQSTFLTSHLASWGMIVVSPEHPSRDLTNVLAATASGDRADSVDDLLQSLDLITAEGDNPASLFAGHVDVERVAAVGHSAGGGTILGAADDPRVDGYVSLASGAFLRTGTEDTTTTSPPALPSKPSFFIAGSVDAVVPAETVTRPSYELAPSPSLLWIIDGVGHNGFDDFCTFGNGTGIIGVADASGLGALLDAQPQLRRLGEDGCVPPAVDVNTTFPTIDHAVTAWLRHLFGSDAEQMGLGEDFASEFAVPVEIASK